MLSLQFSIILIKSFEWWISIQQMFLSIQVYKYNQCQYLISPQFESLSICETGPIVESWKRKEFAKPLLAPGLHYDVVPSMLTSGERRKVLCTMPEHGEGDVFTSLLQFLINQLQQLILGKNEFQYILLNEYFIQQLSLCMNTNISLWNCRWIKKCQTLWLSDFEVEIMSPHK